MLSVFNTNIKNAVYKISNINVIMITNSFISDSKLFNCHSFYATVEDSTILANTSD